MKAIIKTILAVFAGLCATGLDCSVAPLQFSGGSSDTEICGLLITAGGQPASNTQVTILPGDYNPVSGLPHAARIIDTTGSDGRYTFRIKAPFADTYSIQALQLVTRERALIAGIHVDARKDSTIVLPARLSAAGVIKIIPDSVDAVHGYYYIPGTLYSGTIRYGFALIDSVPGGPVPSVNYAAVNTVGQTIVREDIPVPPGDTVVLRNTAWRFARQLYLNTTASGAQVNGDVIRFPLLIRLSSGNFSFGQAKTDGNDIRYAKSDGTFLPYEIERWDSAGRMAEIWVLVDTVYGNNSTQCIVMYWGNASAGGAASSAAVFDTGASGGFQGVWHLAEAGNTAATDATDNHYDGTPYGMSAASAVSGAIGVSRAFDGASSCLRMAGTANSKLNFPENGVYSLSAWVNADSIDGSPQVIAGKGHEDYYLKLMSNAITRNQWEFVEYHNRIGWEINDETIRATAKTWKYLVGVRNGVKQYLYRDGVLIDSVVRTSICDSVRVETDDFSIGRYLHPVTFVDFEGMCTFSGKIDEVRVSSFAPGADWIRLCYMNQKPNDALISFR